MRDHSRQEPVWKVDEQSHNHPSDATGEIALGTIFRPGADREIRDLLRALVRVETDRAFTTLVVSAGAQERETVKRIASELSILERVRLVANPGDISVLVSQFDILALPIYEDAVPVVVLEAMAAGKPVITTAGARLSHIIANGINGYLIPEGDINSLASALALLLRESKIRKAIGAEAQSYAKRMYGGSLIAGREAYGYTAGSSVSPWRRALKRLIFAVMPSKRLFWHVKTDRDQFALTFDDGPDPIYTPGILDTLHAYSMSATFFLVANRAEENLDLVRRIVAEGHEIANHSYTHPKLGHCSIGVACDEVRHAGDVLRPFQQSPRRFFRPPFGHVSVQCLVASWTQNCTVAMWSVDLKDHCANSTKEIMENLSMRPIVRGDVVLYHGTNAAAFSALPMVLDSAMANGLRSVPLSELVS